MKKLLLILLSLFIIFIPSCYEGNKFDDTSKIKPLSYPIVNLSKEEIEQLSSIVSNYPREDENQGPLDISNTTGNINIENAFTISVYTLLSNVNYPDILNSFDNRGYSEKFIIMEEKDLFSDGSEDLLYLFFVVQTPHSGHKYLEITSANFEAGIISINVLSDNTGVLTMFGRYLFVLKLNKNSFAREIKDIAFISDSLL